MLAAALQPHSGIRIMVRARALATTTTCTSDTGAQILAPGAQEDLKAARFSSQDV